jgi:hypothetical protein
MANASGKGDRQEIAAAGKPLPLCHHLRGKIGLKSPLTTFGTAVASAVPKASADKSREG